MSRSEQPRYYRVVVNGAGGYGIWPIHAQSPAGWYPMPFAGDYNACVGQVRQLTELRQRRDEVAAASRTIQALRSTAARWPTATAVADADATLTRAELMARADALAALLAEHGVTPGSLVLIPGAPSADVVVAVIAVLIANASCVLADPAHIGDGQVPTGVGFLLAPADDPAAGTVARDARTVRCATSRQWLVSPVEECVPMSWHRASAAIAVPTGEGHQRLLVPWRDRQLLRFATSGGLPVGPGDQLRLRAAPGSPAFAATLLSALLSGAELTLQPGQVNGDAQRVLWFTAVTEPPEGPVRAQCRPPADHHPPQELFGFPETGMFVATGHFGGETAVLAPLPDSRLYVLDDDLRPVPPGDSGWLHVGGAGVAEGYLDGPELSLCRFLPDPLGAAGGLMFRTGLRCRKQEDGAVELLEASPCGAAPGGCAER